MRVDLRVMRDIAVRVDGSRPVPSSLRRAGEPLARTAAAKGRLPTPLPAQPLGGTPSLRNIPQARVRLVRSSEGAGQGGPIC